jgi:hypothetical protein
MTQTAKISFNDETTEARTLRFEQALVDAEIEGIERDPDGEAFLRQMFEQGIGGDERRARLKAYLQGKEAHTLAAE